MVLRVKKSDPAFERLFDLSNRVAMLNSPHRWFNLSKSVEQTGAVEHNAILQMTLDELDAVLVSYKIAEGLETVKYMEEIIGRNQ